MHFPKMIFLIVILIAGCGGPRPSGDVDVCEGSLGKSEVDTTVITNTFSAGQKVGEHFHVRTNIILNSVMLRTQTSGLTSMIINIYNMPFQGVPDLTTPIKTFTVTTGLSTTGKEELWLALPETFELPADSGSSADNSYFISFEGTGGSFTADVATIGGASSFRQAYREFTSTTWSTEDQQKSLSFGLAGDSDCNVFQGL